MRESLVAEFKAHWPAWLAACALVGAGIGSMIGLESALDRPDAPAMFEPEDSRVRVGSERL